VQSLFESKEKFRESKEFSPEKLAQEQKMKEGKEKEQKEKIFQEDEEKGKAEGKICNLVL